MKVHARPLVILVTRQEIVREGVGQLLAEYGLEPSAWQRLLVDTEGDKIPEMMGRLCYGSFGPRQGRVGAVDYLANVIEGGHGSVLEHAVWGFVVCRASRGFTHQMVRHRAGFAYSQESQHFIRYSDMDEEGGTEAAVCVTGLPEGAAASAVQWALRSLEAYGQIWKVVRQDFPAAAKVKKIVSGLARGVLPGMMESRIGVTGNARALRHFCELRGTEDNVEEIRIVACDILAIMKREAPAIFQDLTLVAGTDGRPVVASGHRKV